MEGCSVYILFENRQFINNKLQPVTAEETGRRMRILYGVRKVIRLLAPFHSNIQLLIPMRLICREKQFLL